MGNGVIIMRMGVMRMDRDFRERMANGSVGMFRKCIYIEVWS